VADEQAVLAANEAFYRAFAAGEAQAMDELWARHAPVACIHPGWPPLSGREEVMQSWRVILNEGPRRIRCHEPRAHLLGEAALVTCLEDLDEGLLAAANLFVREGGSWKIAHHQAGPMALSTPSGEAGGGRLH
jgi:hypothetical protein